LSRARPPPPEDVRIERIGAEGDGIAHLRDGTSLYLPGVLPGETVRAQPVARRRDAWAGEVLAILAPSSERIAPPCPHFGICGGCALQHWRGGAYAAWKSGLLESALRRAGYAPSPAPLSGTPPGGRRRMDLAARRRGGSIVLGLHRRRAPDVVDLEQCPVLHPALGRLLAPLRALLARLAALERTASVIANLLDSGPDLLLRTDGILTATDRARLAAFATAHALPRVAWAQGDGAPETACQLRPAVTHLSGVAVAPPPGAFLQASREGEAAIVAAVLAGLPEPLPRGARVAELYAGCGTLTFALAARVRVAAFEGDAAAAASLAGAANRAGLAGRIEVQRRDLARQPLRAAELTGFAAVVLDPPQAGAAPAMPEIAASGVARVIYASCNPATLGRDAAVLRGAGYALRSAAPVDQFLWSARLESVVVFGRADQT
jgi:23S rRNA (uracil1939-C5)-methyltransferase